MQVQLCHMHAQPGQAMLVLQAGLRRGPLPFLGWAGCSAACHVSFWMTSCRLCLAQLGAMLQQNERVPCKLMQCVCWRCCCAGGTEADMEEALRALLHLNPDPYAKPIA